MATAAAAVILQARREIQHHFFAADAVRADRAVPFTPNGMAEAGQFDRMLVGGIIRREGPDRYWLDVVAYDAALRSRHKRVKLALMLLSAVLAVGLIVNALSG
jgi:hypothetical protein